MIVVVPRLAVLRMHSTLNILWTPQDWNNPWMIWSPVDLLYLHVVFSPAERYVKIIERTRQVYDSFHIMCKR